MRIRLITAGIALCLFIPICYFSDTIVYPAIWAVMSFVAVCEMWNCINHKEQTDSGRNAGFWLLHVPNYLITIGAPFLAFHKQKQALMLSYTGQITNAYREVISILAGGMFLLLLYYFGVAVFSKGKISIESLAVLYMMTFYIIVSFTCLVLLRNSLQGDYLYLLPFAGAWISDTFAYFTGRFLGKHKLIPEVSPKKTVEGCVGGIVFTAIGFMVYGFIISKLFYDIQPDYLLLAISGAVVSVIAQIGDLIASVIKRHYGIKDYGKLFPGHGGVMDRFDSVLSTAPVVYILTVIFSQSLL